MEFYTVQIPPTSPPPTESCYFDLNIEADTNLSFTNMKTGEKFCIGSNVETISIHPRRGIIRSFKVNNQQGDPVRLIGKMFGDKCVSVEVDYGRWEPISFLKLVK